MSMVNMHEAKTHFSELIERIRMGEEIVIARNGKPIARLVPYETGTAPRRELGSMRGQIWMADDFDAPLPPEVLAEFLGSDGGEAAAGRSRASSPVGTRGRHRLAR